MIAQILPTIRTQKPDSSVDRRLSPTNAPSKPIAQALVLNATLPHISYHTPVYISLNSRLLHRHPVYITLMLFSLILTHHLNTTVHTRP
jgi:hypothetical protein